MSISRCNSNNFVESQWRPPSASFRDIEEMRTDISLGIINAANQFLNPGESGLGMCYPEESISDQIDKWEGEIPKSFFNGHADEDFFELTSPFSFKLKEGKSPSDAILSFLKGPTSVDCWNAILACYHKCILDILGKDKFDQIFTDLAISRTDGSATFAYLCEVTTPDSATKPLEIGEFCHFRGVKGYLNKHPMGNLAGENVVYVGENRRGHPLFRGFGFKNPLTQAEINERFIEGYNQEGHLVDTIDPEEAKKNPSAFLEGWLYRVRIVPEKLFSLKTLDAQSIRFLVTLSPEMKELFSEIIRK